MWVCLSLVWAQFEVGLESISDQFVTSLGTIWDPTTYWSISGKRRFKKLGFHGTLYFVDPIWQLIRFWQDRNERKHILHLCRPRVSNFLSHRIVKSLTRRIFGKLELQCTRNGTQKPPICPGSIQDTFLIFSSISHHQIFQTYSANTQKS